MTPQLDAIGLDWAYFDACRTPPADLPHDPSRTLLTHGRALTPGELGCFASHWALWRMLAASETQDHFLILEDDLILDPVFFAALDQAVEAMESLEYLRLYAKVPAGIRLERPFLRRHIARFSGRAYGTQAYIVSREGARRWLSSITRIERPIDDEMDRYWAHGIPILSVFPFPVMEVDYGSTIGATRRAPGVLTRVQRWRWQGGKMCEKLRRHWSDLTSRVV